MTIIFKVYQPSNIQTAVSKKKLNVVFDEIPKGLNLSVHVKQEIVSPPNAFHYYFSLIRPLSKQC